MPATEIPSPIPPIPDAAPPRLRLDFLDGLRGLAALYVVLFHTWDFLRPLDNQPAWARHAIAWMSFGRSAVAVFIVISGYCLMLPVARAQTGHLRDGTRAFFRRRALRILPPYYAALVLAVLVDLVGRKLGKPVALTPGDVWSHVLLVHDLRDRWLFTLDLPMWSVAVEWHIYFLFALLLLPVRRRFGIVAAVAVAFAVGLAPHYLWHAHDLSAPWYLGLFALGMAGAVISTAETGRQPWGLLAILLALAYMGLMAWRSVAHHDAFHWMYLWPMDVLIGAATLCLILCGARPSAQRPRVVTLLEARPIFGLGLFSYSVYLTHHPILTICHSLLHAQHLPPLAMLAAMLLGAVPLAIVFSYLFHVAFERPFLTSHQRWKIGPQAQGQP